jgi:hypothetical protein
MSRIVYYVIPEGTGWNVVGEGATWSHPTRESASRRAMTYARYQGEICGRPAGVLMRRPDGQGFERIDYGVDDDATAVGKAGRK